MRNCSKGKLRLAISTALGLKGVKIAWNVMKVGVHACLSNMHPNIWSGLNFKNLVKLRLHRAVLLGFGLKMPKIPLNIVKVGMHSYFTNALLNLWWNFNSKRLFKVKLRLARIYVCLLNGYLNLLLNLISKKLENSVTF